VALFITFEGGEGCGKSLQSKNLYRKLVKLALPALLIHEPGGTPLGEKIRYLLKKSCDIPVAPLSELLLFNASRSQLVLDVILPALKDDKIVICDRFTDSTVAYQSFARGLDLKTVNSINAAASQGLKPDITFLLDVEPEVGLSRKKVGANDRFEKEALAFHLKVRKGFLEMAQDNPRRWVIIDAALPAKEIENIIWKRISRQLKKA
jgi:dTMP kinase